MKYLALTYVFPTALIIGLLGIFKKGIYQKHIFRNGWFLFIINSFAWLLIVALLIWKI
jgi:hypothetical protein